MTTLGWLPLAATEGCLFSELAEGWVWEVLGVGERADVGRAVAGGQVAQIEEGGAVARWHVRQELSCAVRSTL